MNTADHAQALPSADPNPALLALFDILQPIGSEWSAAKRGEWLRFAEMMLNRLYKDEPE